jgi:acyl carrier protein
VPARLVDEQRVKEIIAAVYMRSPRERPVGPQDIGTDLLLYSDDATEPSLGLDSLDAVEIATELEEAFDLVLPDEIDPADLRTLRDAMSLLTRLAGEQHGTAG